MIPVFSENEARIIGCLLEKSVTTPEQYPLTLNSLINACNQKSARDPVMSLQSGLVQRTVRDLQDKHLVRADENFKSRTEKYVQRFCNTRFCEFQFDPPQLAIVCLLLLRGPQTPGELRARSGRLHAFADNADVVHALGSLIDFEKEALVVKLSRKPGRKDSEYMHLFCGAVDTGQESKEETTAAVQRPLPTAQSATHSLQQRVEKLEAEVAELKALLSTD
jgi:uncharacterized protein YceH (UPF0502 family)